MPDEVVSEETEGHSEPDVVQEAEAQKLLAEAERERAETEKVRLEAALTREKLSVARIQAADEKYHHDYGLASDAQHNIYRFNKDVSQSSVKECIHTLTAWSRMRPDKDIEVVFSCPGGSVLDGLALYDFLRELSGRGHKVVTGNLGHAASMAAILLQAGDHRWAGQESWYLIHRAAFGSMGYTFEVEDRVEWIKRIESRIVSIFERRSNDKLTRRKIEKNWERKDWWLDADQLREFGLVDEVRGGSLLASQE